MPTETINFRLAKQPLIKEKIIVLEETDGRKAVIFPMYRQKHEIEHAEVAKSGEVLELTGKWGTDKKTGKPQFYVDKAFNAKLQKELDSRPPIDVSGVTEEEGEDIPFWDRFNIEIESSIASAKSSYDPSNYEYPPALFDGDPYAINPEVDFADNIKKINLGDKVIYTDDKMYWFKDNPTLRNKAFITKKLREVINNAQDPLQQFATY